MEISLPLGGKLREAGSTYKHKCKDESGAGIS